MRMFWHKARRDKRHGEEKHLKAKGKHFAGNFAGKAFFIKPSEMFAKKVRRFSGKKGSSAVFLCMITISMIGAAFAFSNAAQAVTEKSMDDCMFRLAGRSVLSEYLIPLKDDYGIFAFRGSEEEICDRLRFYLSRSVGGKAAEKSVSADTKEYQLTDADAVERQVLAAAKFSLAEGVLDAGGKLIPKKDKNAVKTNFGAFGGAKKHGENSAKGKNGAAASESGIRQGASGEGRKIKNRAVINGLPSAGIGTGGTDISAILSEGLPSLEDVFKKESDKFLVNRYIMQRFKNRMNAEIPTNTYFANEAEYILFGKLSDDDNARAFMTDFVILRTGLNLAHIYSDPQKVRELVTMAELMTPGPEAAVTQAVLAGSWAFAEAENDKQLLLAGENVAFIKTRANWALELDSAVNGTAAVEGLPVIRPKSGNGNDYGDYIEIFLFIENRNKKLLRMMDLIQINMKLNYDRDFLLKEYNTGFRLSATEGSEVYVYDQRYGKNT